MGFALQKTLSFVLLIVIGLLLKKKFTSADQLKGIKILILSIALPAYIFIALLKINIQLSLIALPIIALIINGLLFASTGLLTKIIGIKPTDSNYRSLHMLVPSFAPGLTCFPFLTEYLGEESLAMAALADVGNKIFVLIILYLLAMHWYYKLNNKTETDSGNSRVKELLLAMIKEPINAVLLVGIGMLLFGFNLQSLPVFAQSSIERMSALMTPMVLIFIGLAVKVRKGDIGMIMQVLFWRSGVAFLISAALLAVLPASISTTMLLLAVVFPQSACSFWPFAHMTAVNSMEGGLEKDKTFNLDLGLNLLAFSMPFSTILILGICSVGDFFADPIVLLIAGGLLVGVTVLIQIAKKAPAKVKTPQSSKREREAVSPKLVESKA